MKFVLTYFWLYSYAVLNVLLAYPLNYRSIAADSRGPAEGTDMPLPSNDEVQLPMYKDKPEVTHWARTNSFVWGTLVLTAVVNYGSYSVLVHLSKVDGHLPYRSYSVVFFIELIKLSISLVLFIGKLREENCQIPSISMLMVAALTVPSILYSLNNNLCLQMQLQMDPTTFQVLSNLKIGTTALLYRYIMKRALSTTKWIAIGLLLLAGVCDSYGGFYHEKDQKSIFITKLGIALLLIYVTISGLASVITEYIFKKYMKVSLNLQNSLMYSSGILINGAMFVLSSIDSTENFSNKGLLEGFSIYTWIVIITQALNGLMMSIVIKHGTNLTRLFIISGGMLVTTFLSVVVLGTKINFLFILASCLVILAIYLYHK